MELTHSQAEVGVFGMPKFPKCGFRDAEIPDETTENTEKTPSIGSWNQMAKSAPKCSFNTQRA
jgi:hypothetical protein